MKDLMIDLETLGTGVDAPIISIGAVWFDIEKKVLGDTFYAILDVADQMDSKIRYADSSTLKWWMTQKDAAKTVFKDGAHPSKMVLETFRKWILDHAKVKDKGTNATKGCMPWGNGASFDITLMETLFKDYGTQCPWLYYNVMDLRTFKRFVAKGKKVVVDGTAHNALDDAIAQAKYVMENS